MSSSTRPVRTYSRRQSVKNAAGLTSPSPGSSGRIASSSRLSDEEERPRKRRTLLRASIDMNGQEGLVTPPRRSPSRSKPGSRGSNRSPELPTAPSSPTHENSSEGDHVPPDKGKGKAVNGKLLDNISYTSSLPAIFRDVSPSASESSTSHLTTPKKPKDLSGIFEAASPQRRTHSQQNWSQNSPGKSGITKKMLSRSRTESSIESSPSRMSRLTPKSQSLVIPGQTGISYREDRSPSRSLDQQLPRDLSRSPVTSGGQQPQREGASNGRTYAGKSRSFLVALPATALITRTGEPGMKENTLDEDDEEYLRDSYAELRKRYGVDNSEGINVDSGDVESTGEGLSLYNPLSSITDLRSKGESRRFRDEVGYLFEGLEPLGALSVRRSSAFDIVSKLCVQEFWRKTKAAGLILEIWDRLRDAGAGNGDKVLDPILCCFVSLASEDPRDVSLLASKEDFVETIIRLMVTHAANDPLVSAGPNDKIKLSKAETMTLNRLRAIMCLKTDVVHEECQPSTRLLLSCSLSSAPSLAFPHLTVILDSVAGDLASVCSRVAAYKSGLALFTDAVQSSAGHEKLCFEHIYNCLAILDLYLIEAEALGSAPNLSKTGLRQRYRALPNGLVALLVVADIINRDKLSDALRTQATRCSELAFRILINLSNGSSTWTDAVAADPYTLPTIIRLVMTSHCSVLNSNAKKLAVGVTAQDTQTSSMDHLCLALALLTNLLQERDNLAYTLQNIMFDVACGGQRSCLLGCRCNNSISAVSGLVNMYISFLKGEDDELAPDLHFLRGHLAVLVGLLLLQLHSPDSSDTTSPVHLIIDDLPGPPDSAHQKLDALIANIDEFSTLYASLTSRVARNSHRPGEKDEDGSDAAQSRNGSDVVADVAASLRALRTELCTSV